MKFAQISAAVNEFKEKFAKTRFAVQRAADLESYADYASDGLSTEKGLLGYWKLDDRTGTEVADSSWVAPWQSGGQAALGAGQIWHRIGLDGKDDYVTLPVRRRSIPSRRRSTASLRG